MAPTVKGFDPKGIFVAHLKSVGYSNLARIFTPQGVEENQGSPETIVSSNIQSKKLQLEESKSRTRQR